MIVAPRLFLNGKFYSGAKNGVHRVADRLIRELDRQAMSGKLPASWDMRLLLPSASNWAPAFTTLTVVPQHRGHTQAWEQIVLPHVARSGALASFANLSPWAHARKLTMVHDAQFRLSPDSYPAKLRWGYRLLVPRGSRSSRIVLTVSDFARDSLATFGIADHDAIRVIHNGADHIVETPADGSILARHGLEPGKFAIIFGSGARYKNVGVVFSAFAGDGANGKTLVVIGPSRSTLVAAGLVPPPASLFVGNVSDGELRALYETAHCLLYPSRTEGFGLPPVEAMFCGCPVVASPAGAIPEICRDAIVYAGIDNEVDWVDAVSTLLSSETRSAKIAAGRARAERFTWEAAGVALVAALEDLLTPRRS